MNFLFEDMIRAETEKYVCRIWRQSYLRAECSDVQDSDLKVMAKELMMKGDISLNAIVLKLAGVDRVNSVEVIDRLTGDGVCVHKDWP